VTHEHSHEHGKEPLRDPVAGGEVIGTELTCREICDFVMAWLDGELPQRERAIFAAHLALCRQCVNYLDGYKATIRLARESHETNPCAALPPVPEDLVKAILAARRHQS
jgi:anti-sigma factor RsiW